MAAPKKAFDRLLSLVYQRSPRHYIIDQTNCYRTARQKKLMNFERHGDRVAMVMLPSIESWTRFRRLQSDDNKSLPRKALLDFLNGFSFPELDEGFTRIQYFGSRKDEGPAVISEMRAVIEGTAGRYKAGGNRRKGGKGKGGKTSGFKGRNGTKTSKGNVASISNSTLALAHQEMFTKAHDNSSQRPIRCLKAAEFDQFAKQQASVSQLGLPSTTTAGLLQLLLTIN